MNEMKSGKAPGLDGFPLQCLKKSGMAVLGWLVRLWNVCFDIWAQPMNWHLARSAPVPRER